MSGTLFLTLALLACGGPGSAGDGTGTESSSTGSGSTTGDATGTTQTSGTDGTSGGTGMTTGSSTGSTGDTGGPEVECWQHLDEGACLAAGCAGMVDALRIDDLATCSTSLWGRVCVEERAPDAGGMLQRTFARELDGSTVFVPTPTCPAAADDAPLPGADWAECTGAPDDPPGCACFCADGSCPGEWHRDEMQQCGLAAPCDVLVANSGGGAGYVATAHCILQALQGNTPAVIEVDADWGDPYEHHWVFIAGDGTARRTAMHGDHACIDCCPLWDPHLDDCTLQAPSFFADCENAVDADASADCAHDVPTWFQVCASAEPVCP